MYYLIYVSTAIKQLTEEELKDILIVSRKNNTRNNITGMLLYGEGTFIQLLEGDEEKVEKTYHFIENDNRHKNLIKLITGQSNERNISNWSMGFSSAQKSILKQIEGYTDPADPDFLKSAGKTVAIDTLKTFAENNKLSGYFF